MAPAVDIAKTANGVTTRYLIDDLNPTGLPQVVEETVNGAPAREYTYGLQRIDENQIVNNAWTPSYYGYDGMGSVRQLTSAGGTVTDTYEYDAFGNRIASSGTTPNNYLYRGEQFDSDLGLYYLRARWYNPQTGRFLSQDPWSGWAPLPKTLHKYLYAGADPENRIDPTGWADLVEENVSLEPEQRSEASVEYVGRRVACILTTTADVLDAIGQTDALGLVGSLTNVGYDLESCAGEAEGERPQQCQLCFAAGTPVHTNHGDVPVQDIKVGDEVLSENAKTGKTEYQPVTALTHPHLDHLLEIRIEGEAEPLRPSTGHPFWVRSAGADAGRWVKAGDLRAGDFLETPAGGWRRVVSVKALAGEQTVYNFTVDQDHDYFVGDAGFLVHNENCGCDIRFTQDSIKTVFKDKRRLQDTIDEMRAAGSYPDSIPPIRIFQRGGLTWTLDNRRLFAAYQAGVLPNTVPIDPEDFEQEIEEKMTTPCEGRFIGIRGGSIE